MLSLLQWILPQCCRVVPATGESKSEIVSEWSIWVCLSFYLDHADCYQVFSCRWKVLKPRREKGRMQGFLVLLAEAFDAFCSISAMAFHWDQFSGGKTLLHDLCGEDYLVQTICSKIKELRVEGANSLRKWWWCEVGVACVALQWRDDATIGAVDLFDQPIFNGYKMTKNGLAVGASSLGRFWVFNKKALNPYSLLAHLVSCCHPPGIPSPRLTQSQHTKVTTRHTQDSKLNAKP